MAVKRTSGSGTRYHTKVRSSSKKSSISSHPKKTNSGKSGSAKLKEFKEKTSSSSSKMESPKEYNDRVEAQKAAEAAANEEPPRISTAPQGQYVPSPVNPAYHEQYLQQQSTFDASSPHQTYGSDVTQPVSITDKPKTDLGYSTKTTSLKEEAAMAYGRIEEATERQIEKGYEQAEDTKPSDWTISFSEKAKDIAEGIRERKEIAPQTAFKPAQTLSPLLSESSARIVETAGMVPGGLSVISQEPAIIPTAILAGAGLTFTGMVTSAKEEPAQFLSDIVVGAGIGYGAGKAGGLVSESLPKVTLKSKPQEFLVKTKIPESTEIKAPTIEPITQAEFMGRGFGKEGFKVSEIQSQVTTFTEQPKGTSVLVGETKSGVTDVYIKTTEAQAKQLSKQFTGDIEQIRSGDKSYLAFEPTGEIATPIYDKFSGARIGTTDTIQIGTLETPTQSIKTPFRLETKKTLTPAELKQTDPLVQLPESTITIETMGKVETGFNMGNYWKQPKFEEPLQLQSGIKTITEQKQSFFASERATLLPRQKQVQYYEPTFIGDMPEMQTRFIRMKGELTVKEPTKDVFDISQMQKLYEESTIRTPKSQSQPRITLDRSPSTKKGILPFMIANPFIKSLGKEQSIPESTTISSIVPDIAISSIKQPYTEKSTSQELQFKTVLTAITQAPNQKGITAKTLIAIPTIELPKKRAKKKKRTSKKQKYSKEQEFTQLKNPLRDFRDVFGFRK